MTGIPLQAKFKPVSAALGQEYRQELDLPAKAKVLFIIGGGLGSQRVNEAVSEAVPHLLSEFPDLVVIHGVGRANEESMQAAYDAKLSAAEQGRLRVYGYINDVYRYSGAADLVITRAGATNLAEFALQGRACIVVPSPFLAAGHQLKNATYLAEQRAAVVLNEADLLNDPHRLAKQVSDLLHQPKQLAVLGENLHNFAKPHATEELAQLILKSIN